MRKQIKNKIAFVLDVSGSMCDVLRDVKNGYCNMLDTIYKRSKEDKHKTEISLLTFNTEVKVIEKNVVLNDENLKKLKNINLNSYGYTALYDAFEKAVKTIDDDNNDDNQSYLIVLFTDGEENCSTCTLSKVKQYIEGGQNDGRWTFTFQVPVNYKYQVANRFGVHLENVSEWESTKQGTKEAVIKTMSSLDTYMGARSKGIKSVNNFYEVKVDLDKVDAKAVHTKLNDISDQLLVFNVEKEEQIRDFIERKAKKDYVIGSCYYQLTKNEKIQKNKQILVMEKGKKAIWGGKEARHLIGLPDDKDAKVTAGNMSNYDIFIQSTSVNRILVRGTKLIWDKNHTKNSKPTWDHTVVDN